jgi:hypothetical protein
VEVESSRPLHMSRIRQARDKTKNWTDLINESAHTSDDIDLGRASDDIELRYWLKIKNSVCDIVSGLVNFRIIMRTNGPLL